MQNVPFGAHRKFLLLAAGGWQTSASAQHPILGCDGFGFSGSIFPVTYFPWIQEIFYGIGIPWTTCLAMPLVVLSVIMHSVFPPQKGAAKVKKA